MGQVYAARDEQLGRRVALKLVAASAGEEALEEARTTARFSHPNIVTLYMVGTYRGHPYLALEYLEGETLRERLRSGLLSVQEALRIGGDIAEALREAHAHRIQHRDLHPRNVFLCSDGRLRILDFGLSGLGAPRLDAGRGSLRGTPAYMAPEQWRGEPLSPAVDVWALGLLLYESLTGVHPYTEGSRELAHIRQRALSEETLPPPSQLREGVTETIDALVMACLTHAPGSRPSADELVLPLRSALSTGADTDELAPSPFKGLMAFTERDAGRFYGREGEVAGFVERLRKTSFVTVIGASGAGKSSFVQAGAIPRLRELGPLVVIDLRPGRFPLNALAKALAPHQTEAFSGSTVSMEQSGDLPAEVPVESEPDQDLPTQLLENPARLGLHLHNLAEHTRGRVLLFVDQLEEVVTLCHDEEERSTFVQAVSLAAEDPSLPVRVVVTLREEFLSAVEAARGGEGGTTQVTVLRTPDRAALRRVLLQPVADAQHRYDDEVVVDEMIGEAVRSSACLPLLQFGGAKLWEGRDVAARTLLRSTYNEMGGLAGALAHHADQVLSGLDARDVPIGRALCLRLVTPERTRRTVPRSELLEGLGKVGEDLLQQFLAARLVVSRKRGDEGREEELELVHESLITTWARLAGWIANSSEELVLLGEAERAATVWERHGRRESDLWRGDALSDAQRTLRNFVGEIPPRVGAFLAESEARERRRRWRNRAALVSLVAVLAVAALGFARGQLAAERQRRRAEAARAEVELEGAKVAAERGQIVEARAKLRSALETRDASRGRWLWRQLLSERREWQLDHEDILFDVRQDPRGRYVAAAVGPSALLYEADTGDYQEVLSAKEILSRLAFSPAGSRLAGVTRWTRGVEVWRVDPSGPSRSFEVEPPEERDPAWAFTNVGWASETELMVHKGSWLYVWDLDSGSVRAQALGRGDGAAFAIVPSDAGAPSATYAWSDDRHVLFGGEGEAEALTVGASGVSALALTPARSRVAVGFKSGRIEVWNYDARTLEWHAPGHSRRVEELRFDPSGARLLSEAEDGVRLWSVGRPEPLESFGCPERASGADLSSDGHLLFSCREGQVFRRATDAPSVDEVVTGHSLESTLPAFSPDGQLVVSGSLDRSVRLWRTASGRAHLAPIPHATGVFFASYDPRGRFFVTAQQNGALQVLDPQSGSLIAPLLAHVRGASEMAFSAEGGELISTSMDRTVRRWSLDEMKLVQTIEAGCQIQSLAVDAGGGMAVSCFTDGRILVFDAGGTLTHTLQRKSPDNSMLRWTRNGELLYGPDLGEVALWSPERGSRTVMRRGGGAMVVGFHAPSGVVALSLDEGPVDLVSLDAPETSVRIEGSPVFTSYAEFDADGGRVVTTGWDGAVRLWRTKSGAPIWRTQAFLADGGWLLSHQGWLGLDEVPVRAAAPPAPAALVALLVDEGWRAEGARGSACAWKGGELRWFDLESGVERAWSGVHPLTVVPIPKGCVLRGPQGVRHFPAKGEVETWVDDPSGPVTWSREGVWVGVGTELRRFGEASGSIALPAPATALAPVGAHLAVGYEGGRIELFDPDDGDRSAPRFERPLLERVARLAEGPGGTVVAGYLNGAVRIWDLASGALVLAETLNGSISHLQASSERLLAVTDAGAFGSWSLESLTATRCGLLERIWETVPFTWEGGAPVRKAPPADHPCRGPR